MTVVELEIVNEFINEVLPYAVTSAVVLIFPLHN